MRRFAKHINPASVLALVALVFAVTGGAYAASSGGGGNGGAHASASASVARAKSSKKRKGSSGGKPGPRGPAGPAGPAGPQGPAGAKGETGKEGAAGKNGENGKGEQGVKGNEGKKGENGKGVTVLETAANCEEGGITVEVEGSHTGHEVCNGENGQSGFTESLPAGKTEEGTWSAIMGKTTETVFGTLHLKKASAYLPISFNIPLASAPSNVEIEPEGYSSTEGECPGSAAAPAAAEGYVCIYTSKSEFTPGSHAVQVKSTGGVVADFIVSSDPEADEGLAAYGTWAVTAPAA